MSSSIICNEDFNKVMNGLINQWFRKWRDHTGWTDDDWDKCVAEFIDICRQYPYQIIRDIGCALVEELERRDKQNADR
jgi:hypothetical protein